MIDLINVSRTGTAVWINPKRVCTLEETREGTKIIMAGSADVHVTTPMDEMVALLRGREAPARLVTPWGCGNCSTQFDVDHMTMQDRPICPQCDAGSQFTYPMYPE